MCVDPVTLTAISIGLTVASTAAAGVGQISAANAQQQQMNQQAALDERRAADALALADEAESDQRAQAAQLYGDQIARMAANGLDISAGSALTVLGDTKVIEESDSARIRESGRRQAEGFEMSAANNRAAGANAKRGGYMQAAGTFLGGATQVAGGLGKMSIGGGGGSALAPSSMSKGLV